MHACIDRIIQTINIRKKKMLQSITTEIMRNYNFFLRITKIFGGSPDFMNWASGGCPDFFS